MSNKNFVIEYIANLIDIPYDQIHLVASVGASFPLGIINHYIKNRTIRLWYGLIFGVLLQYSLYGSGIIHAFISAIFTYVFVKYFGRKYSAFYVFFFTFAYLSCMHLYRIIFLYGQWSADDTTSIYMMNICKYSSLAFAYEDGAKDDKELKNKHSIQYKIKNPPTFLEMMSFTYFYPSACIGPSFEFKDFIDFINFEGCYANLPVKFIITSGLKGYVYALLMMAFYGALKPKIPLEYVGTVEYGKQSVLYKYIYLTIAMTLHRAKFYSGWLLSYAGFIISGIAYTEDDNKEISFSKGSYGSIIDCEFGINIKTKITSWNNTVSLWLKYSWFLRLINVKSKTFYNNKKLASLLTFMMSAFWHGFYPTYYVFFFLFFLLQNANEYFDKLGLYTYIRSGSYIKRIPMWLFSQFMVNSLGAIIFNLEWGLFIQFMKNIKCVPIFIILVLCVYTKVMSGRIKKKEIKKE